MWNFQTANQVVTQVCIGVQNYTYMK